MRQNIHRRVAQSDLISLVKGVEQVRYAWLGVLESLEPIAAGTPGLPAQLEAVDAAAVRFFATVERIEKLTERIT